MANIKLNRILLAGTGSGCGKTTYTCAILKALMNRGMRTASFKCGPDYIDPMFHSEVIGAYSRNLDTFLCGRDTVKTLLARGASHADIAVIEGVMGFYDGLGGKTPAHSSCELANETQTPVLLIVDCGSVSLSAAAVAKGFRDLAPNTIRGILLNHVAEGLYPSYKEMIEFHTGLPVLGYLPWMREAAIESRHLGLITAAEIDALQEKISRLAVQAEQTVDIPALLHIAQEAPPLEYTEPMLEKGAPVRIAVARDKAFCFYYEDAMDLLRDMGAELVPFSPLEDTALPDDCQGMILGGGYPELYARQLSANTALLQAVRQAVQRGMPTWAECGGFMYLGESLQDQESAAWPMAGALPIQSEMTGRLQNFGYTTLTAREDNLFCRVGEGIPAHEFHFSKSDDDGHGFTAQSIRGKTRKCCMVSDTLFAGYPHIHLWGNIAFAKNFLDKARSMKEAQG